MVDILKPPLDAFQNVSLNAVLTTSKMKRNCYDDGWLCSGVEHRARPRGAA